MFIGHLRKQSLLVDLGLFCVEFAYSHQVCVGCLHKIPHIPKSHSPKTSMFSPLECLKLPLGMTVSEWFVCVSCDGLTLQQTAGYKVD